MRFLALLALSALGCLSTPAQYDPTEAEDAGIADAAVSQPQIQGPDAPAPGPDAVPAAGRGVSLPSLAQRQ